MGSVSSIFGHEEFYPAELIDQFAFAGEDFSLRALRETLKERSLFQEARGVISSFVPDIEAREAMRQTFEGVNFSASCEVDQEGSEKAYYSLDIGDVTDDTSSKVYVHISPNALKTIHRPVIDILDASPKKSESLSWNEVAVEVAYRSVYAGVLASYMVKRYALTVGDEAVGVDDQAKAKIDNIYGQTFPENGIDDWAVRLEHIAARFCGAVLLRHITNSIVALQSHDPEANSAEQNGHLLKMYATGLRQSSPRDQHQVTFPLAHAFSPAEAARFVRAWFR